MVSRQQISTLWSNLWTRVLNSTWSRNPGVIQFTVLVKARYSCNSIYEQNIQPHPTKTYLGYHEYHNSVFLQKEFSHFSNILWIAYHYRSSKKKGSSWVIHFEKFTFGVMKQMRLLSGTMSQWHYHSIQFEVPIHVVIHNFRILGFEFFQIWGSSSPSSSLLTYKMNTKLTHLSICRPYRQVHTSIAHINSHDVGGVRLGKGTTESQQDRREVQKEGITGIR